jgi:hypothetical protein
MKPVYDKVFSGGPRVLRVWNATTGFVTVDAEGHMINAGVSAWVETSDMVTAAIEGGQLVCLVPLPLGHTETMVEHSLDIPAETEEQAVASVAKKNKKASKSSEPLTESQLTEDVAQDESLTEDVIEDSPIVESEEVLEESNKEVQPL